MNETIQRHVETLWHYMQCHEQPKAADCLLVLGSRDDRVAVYAATLARQFEYHVILISGGVATHNPMLACWSEATEAAHFAQIMKDSGYDGRLLLEERATNTGENAMLSFKLLENRAEPIPKTIQLVTKSYMERRAKATFEAQWPDKTAQFWVSSPHKTIHEYVNDEHRMDETIHKMVGDMQRIMEYPARGFQSQQVVTPEAKAAYDALVAAGYTNYLMKQ